jgi:hypothetical protein
MTFLEIGGRKKEGKEGLWSNRMNWKLEGMGWRMI